MPKKRKKKVRRHSQDTIIFILMGLIIAGLLVSGYFLFVRKILPEISKGDAFTVLEGEEDGLTTEELAAADLEFIPSEEASKLMVFFPVRGEDRLKSESRRVRRQNTLTAQARQIVTTVLEGPHDKRELYQAIPEGTKLRGIFFEAGTFIIDLSRDFEKLSSTGISEKVLAVYSIINSVTELDPNARVRLLINGTEPSELEGYLDFSQTFKRFAGLIKR